MSEERKTEKLIIRCTRTTKRVFRQLMVEFDYKNSEELLKDLINLARKYPFDLRERFL